MHVAHYRQGLDHPCPYRLNRTLIKLLLRLEEHTLTQLLLMWLARTLTLFLLWLSRTMTLVLLWLDRTLTFLLLLLRLAGSTFYRFFLLQNNGMHNAVDGLTSRLLGDLFQLLTALLPHYQAAALLHHL